MVDITGSASEIVVQDCRLFSTASSAPWSAADWNALSCDGIWIAGAGNTVRENHLLNVNFGITVTGISNRVERNVVENFSGDGLRGLGDHGIFEYNTVKNSYAVNSNHDDGFQSWSVGPGGVDTGVVRGVVLRGNLFINYEDPNQPFRSQLQGIGCFGGYYDDWIVENNVVITDHWHGLTFHGARNCRIVNNTVIDINSSSPGPPWIQISPHPFGTPSSGNVVRNNLATDFDIVAGSSTVDHNIQISNYSLHFRDYAARDLRLLADSSAIDAGSSSLAPVVDVAGLPRSLDGNADGIASPDIGAYEFAHPTIDSDADGARDAEEAVAGTSPLDATDRLVVSHEEMDGAGSILRWWGVLGRTYTISARSDLSSSAWEPLELPQALVGRGAELRVTNSVLAGGYRFFRVAVQDSGGSTLPPITPPPGVPPSVPVGAQWLNFSLPAQAGSFTVAFDVVPGMNNLDAVIGLAPAAADSFADLAAIVRFSSAGVVDARNGGTYSALNAFPYSAGASYRVTAVLNVPQKRYSVSVAPAGGSAVQIASDWSFRTEQSSATSLAHLSLYASPGTLVLTGFSLTSLP